MCIYIYIYCFLSMYVSGSRREALVDTGKLRGPGVHKAERPNTMTMTMTITITFTFTITITITRQNYIF